MLTALAFATAASFARAELTASGDLFVKFSGGIEPNALPRHVLAPVSVRVAGTIRTLSGERPPALRQISIAINRGGHLDTHGLPVCHKSEIEPTTSQQAMAACGSALVGKGSYDADVAFPEQTSFASKGRILAFNSKVNGHRAILAHVYGDKPVPITLNIVFGIRQRSGTFGTVLTGTVPESVVDWGYLNRISLNLHREFVYKGRTRNYLSANCPAPPGFPGAVFPFAQAEMTFEDGRTLASTVTRSCKVHQG
jgi:hypothetical protein